MLDKAGLRKSRDSGRMGRAGEGGQLAGAAEEGGQRGQLPTQISDEGRLAFRQRDMQNGS